MTVTEFSRNLRSIFDRIEHKSEEIVLIRNKHQIARIVPGPAHMDAIEAMADLHGTLPDSAGKDWERDSRNDEKTGTPDNQWDI
jgi:antitoxin (DNA-binding transcriptional repressor) of toxin-antitoxin stability system